MKTIWILGDQLSRDHPAVAGGNRRDSVILMIESKGRGSAQRYHQLKLVLVYSAMRHFAEDLQAQGWRVDYHRLEDRQTFESGVRSHLRRFKSTSLVVMEPNSFAETAAVQELGRKLRLPIEILPTTQFLLPREDFRRWAAGQKRLLMEQHYRRMRRRFGWLMQKNGKPAGGAWNFDRDNRESFAAWKRAGAPLPRQRPREAADHTTQEVIATVAREFAGHPGRAEHFWLPVDRKGARKWLQRFVRERLPRFGAYEDMMSEGEPFLFHSVLSPLINIGLLSPQECIEAALEAYDSGQAPINSVEGYVRQLAGWREFINGVYWLRGPDYRELNALAAERPLPGWFYTAETPMNCLQQVLRQNLDLGWNHHIQRLMVLGNFLLTAGVRPQEALRWFLEMYVDAFDWVMAANVIGMSLHADGGYMATKPYAAGSGYIRRMSNYCAGCRYDPDQKTGPDACPFNYLYWDFIDRHADRFAGNARMRTIVSAWRRRSRPDQARVRAAAVRFLDDQVPAAAR